MVWHEMCYRCPSLDQSLELQSCMMTSSACDLQGSLTCLRIGFKPFMEYAGSYALFNYRLKKPSDGLEYDNLRLIRAFERGLDPTSSEAGFVLVHVAMVKHSGRLVSGVADALDACSERNNAKLAAAMQQALEAMQAVNKVMDSQSFFSSVSST